MRFSVIGGGGIGLSVCEELVERGHRVVVVDRCRREAGILGHERVEFVGADLTGRDFSWLDGLGAVDGCVITAGFGRVAPFGSLEDAEIRHLFEVNAMGPMRILRHYWERLQGSGDFYACVMGSIAGLVSSPLFAVYGATKAALCSGVESLNAELECAGSANRVLNVSPGQVKGTGFAGGENDLEAVRPLAREIVDRMLRREALYIPLYDEVYRRVIDDYRRSPREYGLHSYRYKMEGGRVNMRPQLRVGYLSGTFDLFHVGHLNLLRRARRECDYLVVGVHKDASHKGKRVFIPFEERMAIVGACEYVDRVIPSMPEDCDIWLQGVVKYDYLFVGSDYKGTERFERYERLFADKGVKIVYFPYTQGTSSTQLRAALRQEGGEG